MLKETLISIRDKHKKDARHFCVLKSLAYGIAGGLALLVTLVILAIAYINPFWFRKDFIQFALYTVPEFFCYSRKALFKPYENK